MIIDNNLSIFIVHHPSPIKRSIEDIKLAIVNSKVRMSITVTGSFFFILHHPFLVCLTFPIVGDKIYYWKGGEFVTTDFYNQYMIDFNNIVNTMLAPVRRFADEYTQQLEQIQQTVYNSAQFNLDLINELMYLYHQKLLEFTEYITEITGYHGEVAPSYDLVIDVDIPESLEVEGAPTRSPPDDSFSVKIQVWYLVFLPVILRGLLYCEELVLGDYLLRIIKYFLEFFGVYL